MENNFSISVITGIVILQFGKTNSDKSVLNVFLQFLHLYLKILISTSPSSKTTNFLFVYSCFVLCLLPQCGQIDLLFSK